MTDRYPPRSLRELEEWMGRVSDRRGRRFSYVRVLHMATPLVAGMDLDGRLYAMVAPALWRRLVWGDSSKPPEDFQPRLERWQNLDVIYEPGVCGR